MKAWIITGGGARIVQALVLIERHLAKGGEMPDMIVGSSAGGLLSLLISHCGVDGAAREICSIGSRQELFSDNFMAATFKPGFWSPKPLVKKIADIKARYPKATIPYWTCSYDLVQSRTVYHSSLAPPEAHAATACIPILVEPSYGGVDGALAENTPLKFPIDRGATDCHVFLCSGPEQQVQSQGRVPGSLIEMAIACFNAMRSELTKDDLEVCRLKNTVDGYQKIDVTLHEPERNYLGGLDFSRMRLAYEAMKK